MTSTRHFSSLSRGLLVRIWLRSRLGKRIKLGVNVSIRAPWLLWVNKDGMISIGDGSVISQNTSITAAGGNVVIGRNCYINRNCCIGARDLISLGDHVAIGPGVVMVDSGKDQSARLRGDNRRDKIEPISIGSWSWVGANAVILPGVHIGVGSVVAAGAVVTKSVADRVIVAGVPAIPIGLVPN
jgi:acetyltransferase-like isoleucine patch superfamily enzyme